MAMIPFYVMAMSCCRQAVKMPWNWLQFSWHHENLTFPWFFNGHEMEYQSSWPWYFLVSWPWILKCSLPWNFPAQNHGHENLFSWGHSSWHFYGFFMQTLKLMAMKIWRFHRFFMGVFMVYKSLIFHGIFMGNAPVVWYAVCEVTQHLLMVFPELSHSVSKTNRKYFMPSLFYWFL